MEDNRNNQDKLEINVPAELLEGVYSNLAVITHSSAEFYTRLYPRYAGNIESSCQISCCHGTGTCKTFALCSSEQRTKIRTSLRRNPLPRHSRTNE